MKKILFLLSFFPAIIIAQTTNLFISEYGEGAGGSKKYIEIYNGTGVSVDLSNYQILKSTNGAAWNVTPISLTGSLANNDTYVIANNSTDVIGADFYNTSISHNGDDGYALTWNGGSGTVFNIIDVFGLANGTDPGTSWTVAGSLTATVDKILIRKPTVCSPNTDWATIAGTDAASSQYTIVVDPYNATSQTTDLGIHTTTCVATCNTLASISPIVCATYTVPSGDETYTASGTYYDTIPNAALCDSLLTINLTVTGGTITYYADTDNDTYGDPSNTVLGCTLPVGYVTNSDDCDDSNAFIGIATNIYYLDFDNDTFGSSLSIVIACSAPLGYVSNSLDCNDNDSAINPNGIDILDNGIDEDCSGSDASSLGNDLGMYEFNQASACPVTAIDVTTQPTNAVFGPYLSAGTGCAQTANVFNNTLWNTAAIIDTLQYNQFSIVANNCFSLDLNRIIFTHKNSNSGGTPTWTLRSSLDNFTSDLGTGLSSNVDKTDTINLSAAFDAIDQIVFRFYITNMGSAGATWRNDNVRLIGNFGTLTPQNYFADTDGDNYGDATATISACSAPIGYVLNNTDCNDTDAAINPATIWYQDNDSDTYGNSAVSIVSCSQPTGYVLSSNDCNDANPLIQLPTTYYTDNDNDGHGDVNAIGVDYCTNPGVGFATMNDDCNDTLNTVYPGALEICDGLDNDCANGIDDGLTFVDYFTDADNDDFGTGLAQSLCQNPGIGFALVNGDCDDTNAAAYPGAMEILNNGVDENCDGTDNYLSIEEVQKIHLSIQPNPSNGIFTLVIDKTISSTIVEIIDLSGKVQFNAVFAGTTLEIDLSTLAKGNYILKLQTDLTLLQERIVLQ
jgi:hypothetical protein